MVKTIVIWIEYINKTTYKDVMWQLEFVQHGEIWELDNHVAYDKHKNIRLGVIAFHIQNVYEASPKLNKYLNIIW